MAVTVAEMLQIPGARRVAGNIIIGQRKESKIIASTVEGVFGLTDAGREYFAEKNNADDQALLNKALEDAAPKATRGRKPKVVEVLDETPVDGVQSTDSTE